MSIFTHRPLIVILLVMLVSSPVLAGCGTSLQNATATGPAPASDPTASAPSAATATPQSISAANGAVSFSKDILPIFDVSCIKCHGGEKTSKGLDLKTHDSMMAGSTRGPVVLPGDAAGSKLAQLVINGKMPKRGDKLTAEQIQMIVDWINAGAPNN